MYNDAWIPDDRPVGNGYYKAIIGVTLFAIVYLVSSNLVRHIDSFSEKEPTQLEQVLENG